MVCLVEDDGPADWLDRFYTLIRVALLLMLAFNYASTGKIAILSFESKLMQIQNVSYVQ